MKLWKCKYCGNSIDHSDKTCDVCWELQQRVKSDYNEEAKKKVLNELGWYKLEVGKKYRLIDGAIEEVLEC